MHKELAERKIDHLRLSKMPYELMAPEDEYASK